jgi:hypothetical protein
MKLSEGVSIKVKDQLPIYNKELSTANLFLQSKQATNCSTFNYCPYSVEIKNNGAIPPLPHLSLWRGA